MKEAVIKKAIAMRSRALVPFSNYRVGAAVETQSGEIIGGCNVESSSYGLTCCAERVALFRAVAKGHTSFRSMAIATHNSGMPCGACRQVIWELCSDIPIHICNEQECVKTISSKDLLPDAFDKSKLL